MKCKLTKQPICYKQYLQAVESFSNFIVTQLADRIPAQRHELVIDRTVVHFFLLHLEDGSVTRVPQLLPVRLEALEHLHMQSTNKIKR